MIMLVDIRSPRRNRPPESRLGFVVITLGPWAVLLWLLWPWR
jgi:hypothetical protein